MVGIQDRREFFGKATLSLLGLGATNSKQVKANQKTVVPAFFRLGAKLAEILESQPEGIQILKDKNDSHYIGGYSAALANEAAKINPQATRVALQELHADLDHVKGANPLKLIAQNDQALELATSVPGLTKEIENKHWEIWNKKDKAIEKAYGSITGAFYSDLEDHKDYVKQLVA